MRLLACLFAYLLWGYSVGYRGALSRQISVLDFVKSPSGACASLPVLLDTADNDPDDRLGVQEEMPPA
jgi:hypothetical protein